jgi:tetrahydromethanopterin S-methyltransferase subunit F
LFDGGNYLLGRTAAGQMVTMGARLAGFVIGVVVMVAIPTITGTPVKFF